MDIGTPIKNFTLPDQSEKIHSLEGYRGKKVLVYFYPKDMTSGCTVEAQQFRDNLKKFEALNVQIIGISKDSVKSHAKFAEKESLNFPILADTEMKVSTQFGVWVEKSMYGRKYMGIQRDSFLIDEKGNLEKHYVKVKPKDHVQQVLADLGA